MKASEKIKNIEHLQGIIVHQRKLGKRTVFTNGCFDILHLGHVRYLEDAKAKGDILVVGLNSDESVKRLKGNTRPIVPQYARASVLAGLESVDFVVIFKEDTPHELIASLKPDVLVKGGDWKKEEIAGRDIVESYGGKIELVPFLKGYSTSCIIRRIRDGRSGNKNNRCKSKSRP